MRGRLDRCDPTSCGHPMALFHAQFLQYYVDLSANSESLTASIDEARHDVWDTS